MKRSDVAQLRLGRHRLTRLVLAQLANALVIWEQMPAVTPCQPLPYEKKAIEKMVKLLKEEDKDRSARRDAAIALIPEHLRPSRPATSGVSDVPDRSVMPEAGR